MNRHELGHPHKRQFLGEIPRFRLAHPQPVRASGPLPTQETVSACVSPEALKAPDFVDYAFRRSSAISANSSSAACRSSTISAAITSGAGRLAASSRLSSFSQKMSRLALSRLIRSEEH